MDDDTRAALDLEARMMADMGPPGRGEAAVIAGIFALACIIATVWSMI